MVSPVPNSPLIRFGVYEVDLRTGELRKHGMRIKLQEQPFQILVMLLQRPGELVTREDIKERLWPGGTFVDFDHSVNTAIRRLRDALCDTADNPRFVETLPRRGYRFIGELQHGTEAQPDVTGTGSTTANPEITVSPIPSAPPDSAGSTQERPLPSRRFRGFAAMLAVLLAAAAFLASRFWPQPQTIDSVAVLPFTAEDSMLQYLGDGIAEVLTDHLSRVPALRVVSHNSAREVGRAGVSAREAARRLSVAAVVVGSLEAHDSSLRLSVELIRASDQAHLWGHVYEFDRSQLLTFGPTLAQQVSDGLKLRLAPGPPSLSSARTTRNPRAYELYLRGLSGIHSRDTDRMREALQDLHQAVDLDPNYALPYAHLQQAYGLLAWRGVLREKEALAASETATKRALELAPDLADAHDAAAWVALRRGDWPMALFEGKRAVDLNPTSAEVYQTYARALALNGRYSEAVEQLRIGYELDPEWTVARDDYLVGLIEAGKLSEAEQFARGPMGGSKSALAHVFLAKKQYQLVLDTLKGPGEMRAIEWFANTPLVDERLMQIEAYLGLGRLSEARRVLEDMAADKPTSSHETLAIAKGFAALGDRANAIVWLRATAKDKDIRWLRLEGSRSNKEFAFLRGDPEFEALLLQANKP